MCAGDLIIWKKKTMGTGIVEKNTIRTFSYSTTVQEITLSGLMFFNNRKGRGYRYFSSEKGNVKNINQNLKIHEKAFDNFSWKADKDIADIYLKPFPVRLFICPNGKEVCIWMGSMPGAISLLPDPLKPLHFPGFKRSSRN